MKRPQLEAALRAAAETVGCQELVLAGSQANFGHTDDVPVEVLISEACDIWRRGSDEQLTHITPTLGKNSPYHHDHGVFVDTVPPGLVLLPNGREARLTPLQVGDITAWCLDVNDLVVSKLNAGRLKDYEFVNAVLRARLADFDEVVRRVQTFPDLHQRAVWLARLRIASESTP
jgi:hypothetical protein